MSTQPSQTKVLVFGAIDSKESFNEAISKANKLNSGANGPFGLLVLFAQSKDAVFGQEMDTTGLAVPDLSTYLLINNGDLDGPKYGKLSNASNDESGDNEKKTEDDQNNEDEDAIILLNGKLTLLQSPYGFLKTRSGITLAWFGSTGNVHDSKDRSAVYAAIDFIKKKAPVDLLLTRFYPNWITKGTVLGRNNNEDGDGDNDNNGNHASTNPNEPQENAILKARINKCQDTTLFARAALARYTFVSYTQDPYRRPRNDQEYERSSLFWERLPYYTALPSPAGESEQQQNVEENEEDKRYTLSRFISLAPFSAHDGNREVPKKFARYHYLFVNRAPAPALLKEIAPAGSTHTPSPFLDDRKRKRQGNDVAGNERRSSRRQRHTEVIVNPETCFLCLSSSTVASHMIASIADESYITLARGPLFVPGGRHVLVVPLAHVPTLGALDHTSLKSVIAEREKYMNSLCQLYFSNSLGSEKSANPLHSKVVATFEISRAKNVHCHTQVVAFPEGSAQELVDEFKRATESFGYPSFEEIEEDNDEKENYDTDHLKVCIYSPAGTSEKDEITAKGNNKFLYKTLILNLEKEGMRFNLQFPRKVLAEYATRQPGYEQDRSNWKECVESEKDETKSTNQLKGLFKPFDFSA